MLVILMAMVVIAAGAVLVNHYAFGHKSPTPTTTTSAPFAQALRACEADGATLATAIAAFEAENPNLMPTESDLVSSGLGGPYIGSWAYNPEFYSFTLSKGILYLHAGTDGFLSALPSARFKFVGPRTCLKIGL